MSMISEKWRKRIVIGSFIIGVGYPSGLTALEAYTFTDSPRISTIDEFRLKLEREKNAMGIDNSIKINAVEGENGETIQIADKTYVIYFPGRSSLAHVRHELLHIKAGHKSKNRGQSIYLSFLSGARYFFYEEPIADWYAFWNRK